MSKRLHRLLRLERMIRSGAHPSLREICRTLSIKPRTAYEDLRMLRQEMGLSIEFDRSRNGYFNADPSRGLPRFDLTDEEFLLLVMGCELLCSSLGDSCLPLLMQALEKVEERTALTETTSLRALTSVIRCRKKSELSTFSVSILFDLASACLRLEEVRLEYRSDDECLRTRVVEPLAIVELQKSWTLVAAPVDSSQIEFFGIERITSCATLGSRASGTSSISEILSSFGCLASLR